MPAVAPLAVTFRPSPAERTARDCLRYAAGDPTKARRGIEAAIAHAARASTPRLREARVAQYRAALAALDEMTRES